MHYRTYEYCDWIGAGVAKAQAIATIETRLSAIAAGLGLDYEQLALDIVGTKNRALLKQWSVHPPPLTSTIIDYCQRYRMLYDNRWLPGKSHEELYAIDEELDRLGEEIEPILDKRYGSGSPYHQVQRAICEWERTHGT